MRSALQSVSHTDTASCEKLVADVWVYSTVQQQGQSYKRKNELNVDELRMNELLLNE